MSARRPRRGFDRIGDLLPGVLASQPDAERILEVRLQLAFRAVLGDQLSAQCEEVSVHGGTLWVATRNPALAHQLRLDGQTLLRRLNEESGLGRPVHRLQVRTGRARGAPQ